MEIEKINMTHHVHQPLNMTHHVHQPININPNDLQVNPWAEVGVIQQPQAHHLDNVPQFQPDIQPCLALIDNQKIWQNTASSATSVSTHDNITRETSSPALHTVDDSIHSPPKNGPRNSQTYDARVPVSDIPGSLPSEKSNFLHGWFRGIDALKRIYVDEIFNTDYFVLQFDSLPTMRKLVRNFNEHSDSSAKMTPIVYVKPTANSKHSSPHKNYRRQHEHSFKVVDLDGSDNHINLAKKAILALTHADVVQFLHEQPSPKELHFWINSATHAKKFLDIWSIVIGESVCRLGPARFSKHQFRNRNQFVGRSSTAAHLTDALILTNLESNGAKDIYRRQSDDGSVEVYVVFDSEISYRNAVTKSVWLNNTNLKFSPQTQMPSNINHRRTQKSNTNSNSRSNSPQPNHRSPIVINNTYAALSDLMLHNENVATATNRIPLGQRSGSHNKHNIAPMSDRPNRS